MYPDYAGMIEIGISSEAENLIHDSLLFRVISDAAHHKAMRLLLNPGKYFYSVQIQTHSLPLYYRDSFVLNANETSVIEVNY